MKRNNKKQQGMTLLELMLVVAIIGLLASIALPAYQDYMIRARITELIDVAGEAKAAITEYRITKGKMPTSNALAGLSTTIKSHYIRNLRVSAKGVVTVNGNRTNLGTGSNLAITLTPTFSNGVVDWSCSSKGATQYVPASCK